MKSGWQHIQLGEGHCGWSYLGWQAAGLPKPTLVLQSGHGIHAYWRLDKPLRDLKRWTALQKRLIAAVGSDPSIHDPPRIMRLPGFKNCKARPRVPCHIVEAKPSRCYSLSRLSRAIEDARPGNKRPRKGETTEQGETSQETLKRARAYLARIPGDEVGGRNTQAFNAACALVQDFLLPDAEALPILKRWDTDANNPPLGSDELREVLANARKYANHPPGTKITEREKEPNTAEQLVQLALEKFRFARTDKDERFAVAHEGPNVAIMLRDREQIT